MKKLLICLMVGVYLFGNFSTAFADSRSHNRQFKQKYSSAPHVHKPQVKQSPRTGPRAHKPGVRQKSHRVKKHQPRSRVHKPRFTQRHRPGRRTHNTRVWRKYRPFPRVHYGHRHPRGHRVHVLPHGFISFSIGGLIYYYSSGNYYRNYGGYYAVIQPPIGALIPVPPPGYRIIYIDSHPYYLAGGVYYVWDNIRRGYRVVPPPKIVYESYESSENVQENLETSLNLFVYPKAGQSENEQANDRYDCHLWAVGETDFDPTLEGLSTKMERADYRRAITACLEAREYTVK